MTVSLEDLHAEALALLDGVPEGPELDMRTSALIELAVKGIRKLSALQKKALA